jgi:hypothetical protein
VFDWSSWTWGTAACFVLNPFIVDDVNGMIQCSYEISGTIKINHISLMFPDSFSSSIYQVKIKLAIDVVVSAYLEGSAAMNCHSQKETLVRQKFLYSS